MFVLKRIASRVVLLDSDDQILLIQAHDPARAGAGSWWEIPGGGVERGESTSAAAERELREEVGVVDAEIGPVVWTQHARFTFGGWHFDQQEFVHIARCEAAPDRIAPALESLEALSFEATRWWTLDQLVETGVATLPFALTPLLADLINTGVPGQPVDITDESRFEW